MQYFYLFFDTLESFQISLFNFIYIYYLSAAFSLAVQAYTEIIGGLTDFSVVKLTFPHGLNKLTVILPIINNLSKKKKHTMVVTIWAKSVT